MKKIFAFTFRNQVHSAKYRTAVTIIPVILFLLPLIAAFLIGGSASAEPEQREGTSSTVFSTAPVEQVYVVDETGLSVTRFDVMEQYADVRWTLCSDFENARAVSSDTDNALILRMTRQNGNISLKFLIPFESSLTQDDCSGIKSLLDARFSEVLSASADLTDSQKQAVDASVYSESVMPGADMDDSIKNMASYIVPYVFVFLLYFLVLIYGQGVANSVVMEKSSKLMDTFLIAVNPSSIVFGKVFAIVTASLVQFASWIVALILGIFCAGRLFSLPDFTSVLTDLISVPGLIIAILILIFGFLLYCSVASIGGSAAGKTEDLASTNIMFTLILIVSFFVSLAAGGITSGSASASWIYWIPFTSVLTLPGRLVLGEVSLATGIGALAVMAAVTVFFLNLAGKIYRMMALYKGTPPTPAKLFEMLKKNRTDQ